MLALIIAGLNLKEASNENPGNKAVVNLIVTSIGSKSEKNYQPHGLTALNLLAINHNVTFKHNFIECVNNICADSGYWWKFLVNGKESPVGANFYKVWDGDAIEFRFAKK